MLSTSSYVFQHTVHFTSVGLIYRGRTDEQACIITSPLTHTHTPNMTYNNNNIIITVMYKRVRVQESQFYFHK